MCKQRTALEMIKAHPNHDGLSEPVLLLCEKQCEDFEHMQKEINEIKEDISSVKHNQEEMNEKIDNLISFIEHKSSLSQNIKDILSNKVFLYILITLVCAAFGVSVGEVGTFLFKP